MHTRADDDTLSTCRAGAGAQPARGQRAAASAGTTALPIHLKIIQAGREILEAVDLLVALATVKLKALISEDAVQLGGKRVGARETGASVQESRAEP